MEKGDVYKGFVALETFDIARRAAKCVYLRRESGRGRGLEVLYIGCGDPENLFAFSFRTPPLDSTGVPHIIEHSVLCGSERFRTKEPFSDLRRQTINTFLNAFTEEDRTVYPASSLIRKDYFDLMSVYSDAVFFPLLKRGAFLQEGWRCESGDGGNALQGIVFNEMKGVYSSAESAASDAIDRALLPGTLYENDSGGDPLEIPKLSYEDFVAYHKKYYTPENCLVFLYGDIPLEEQIDALEEFVLSRLEESTEGADEVPAGDALASLSGGASPEPLARYAAEAPYEDGKSVAAVSWLLGDRCAPEQQDDPARVPCEISFVSDLLFGSDSAPVMKSLLRRFPGADCAPQTGCSTHSRFLSATVALRGAALSGAAGDGGAGDAADAVASCVEDALREVCEQGVAKADVERCFLSREFSLKEVRRASGGGPYALTLLLRVLRNWTYGQSVRAALSEEDALDALRERVARDETYLTSLIRKYFLENPLRSVVSVTPSREWSKRREDAERALANASAARIGPGGIAQALDDMRAYQTAPEAGGAAFLPATKVSELKNTGERIAPRKSFLDGIPLFTNEEDTNGIIYASILFPADRLKSEDYKLLPLLRECVPALGTKRYPWDTIYTETGRVMGDFGCSLLSSHVRESARRRILENPLLVGRDWFCVHFKTTDDRAEEAFGMAADIIGAINFDDRKRLKTVVNGLSSQLASLVVPDGHAFAAVRAMRLLNRECAVQEIVNGLTSVFFMQEVREAKTKAVALELARIYKRILSGGAVFHVTAGKSGISAAKSGFSRLAAALDLTYPRERRREDESAFFAQTEIAPRAPREGEPRAAPRDDAGGVPRADEIFVVPGNTGFSACIVRNPSRSTRDVMADAGVCEALETRELWEQVRVRGGAYGVALSPRSSSGATVFATYRDPAPFDSLVYFEGELRSLSAGAFSEDDFERSVLGVYSNETEPYTPALRGTTALMRSLYGVGSGEDKTRQACLLSLTKADFDKALARYRASGISQRVVLCGAEMVPPDTAGGGGKVIEFPVK